MYGEHKLYFSAFRDIQHRRTSVPYTIVCKRALSVNFCKIYPAPSIKSREGNHQGSLPRVALTPINIARIEEAEVCATHFSISQKLAHSS